MRLLRTVLASFGLLVWLGGPAMADVIDGEWCGPDGGRISIQGEKVTTPGGRRITGNYSRHYFTYVVPDGEKSAGGTLHMDLINDETVRLRIQTRSGAPDNGPRETWHRCQPVS